MAGIKIRYEWGKVPHRSKNNVLHAQAIIKGSEGLQSFIVNIGLILILGCAVGKTHGQFCKTQ